MNLENSLLLLLDLIALALLYIQLSVYEHKKAQRKRTRLINKTKKVMRENP